MEQLQRTDDWFKQRKGRVTASAVGAILGVAPYSNRNDVMRRMVREYQGLESEFKGNVATEYGTFHEDGAIKEFELETGLSVKNAPFIISEKYDWLGASPDSIISDKQILEIKCPYGLRNGGDFKSIDKQEHYYAQMQLQMHCTGADECWFYQWQPTKTMLELVKFNQEYFDKMFKVLESFYKEYLEIRDKPIEHDSKELNDLMDTYIKNKELISSLQDKQKEILESMIVLTDNAGGTINNYKLYKTVKKGSISYSKVVKEHLKDLDLESYIGDESEYWSVK